MTLGLQRNRSALDQQSRASGRERLCLGIAWQVDQPPWLGSGDGRRGHVESALGRTRTHAARYNRVITNLRPSEHPCGALEPLTTRSTPSILADRRPSSEGASLNACSRPGTVLTALCAPERVGDLSRVLFEESSTIGLRWSEVSRSRLEREMVTIPTAYGALPFKVSRLGGRVVTVTPEFADVVRLAREKSLPVREVLDQARADARRHFGD